jgi:hypothetical protein
MGNTHKNHFNIDEIIWAGWEVFKREWKNFLLVLVGYVVATIPLNVLDELWNLRLYAEMPVWDEYLQQEVMESVWVAGAGETALYVLFSIFVSVWSVIVGYNLFKAYFKILDKQKVNFGDIFVIPTGEEVTKVVRYFVTCFLYGFIVVIGLILLVVPGIYWGIKYSFVIYIAVDKNLSIMENFRLSAKMTEGIKWKILGLGLLQTLIVVGMSLVGILCLLIGVIPAIFIAIGWMIFTDLILLRKLYHGNL